MAFEFEFDLAAAPQEPQRHYVIASAFCRGAALPTHAAVRDALRQYAATMGGSAIPTMFGRLNLIFCTSEIEYDLWKAGTEYLQELARELGPVQRGCAGPF